MRSFKKIASFLITRGQLALGWKVSFLIVCGALVYASLALRHIEVRSIDVNGTVVNRSVNHADTQGSEKYLLVKLDRGETVRARIVDRLDYRPGQRVVVGEVKTSFFGLREYWFKGYLDKTSGQ